MEAGTASFIQEAFRGFLKCLGLEGGGGKAVAGREVVVDNPPPPSSPPLDPATSTTNYEPLPATDDTPIDSTTTTTRDIDDNLRDQSNYTLVTIDDIINTSGGTTAEAHFVELIDDGQPKMSLLTTSLISSGGGGKSH